MASVVMVGAVPRPARLVIPTRHATDPDVIGYMATRVPLST